MPMKTGLAASEQETENESRGKGDAHGAEWIIPHVILGLLGKILRLGLVVGSGIAGAPGNILVAFAGLLGKILVFCLGAPGEIRVGGTCGVLQVACGGLDFAATGCVGVPCACLGRFCDLTGR